MRVEAVPVDWINSVWGLVEKWVSSGLEYTDSYTTDQVKVYLTNGTWLLLVIVDDEKTIHGALTIAFHNNVNDRSATIVTLAGKSITTKELFSQVCWIAKRHGATVIQCLARDSAARLYERVGLRKKATLMELKI